MTKGIAYDHALNLHTRRGAAAALCAIFRNAVPGSILDVGCGTGTWLRAAIDLGTRDVFGIDGVIVGAHEIPSKFIQKRDLSEPFDLGRRFDLVLCLEVAEHLRKESAEGLVSSIALHSDNVLFSAASPGQGGQHHINCQWPEYWQILFNSNGFVCDDSVRWLIWDNSTIEPWYRQNVFSARRDPEMAGREPRLRSVIHPEMIPVVSWELVRDAVQNEIQRVGKGDWPLKWYISAIRRAAISKFVKPN